MWTMDIDEPLAVVAVEAIHTGDVDRLKRLLSDNPGPAWDQTTPLDAAFRSEDDDLAEWLKTRGAKSARELT